MEPDDRVSFKNCGATFGKDERSRRCDGALLGRLAPVGLALAVACSPATVPSNLSHEASSAPIRAAQGNRVSAVELKPLEYLSLEQALLRLRPNFLRVNSSAGARPGSADRPTVYIDNSYVGAPDALQLVPVAAVEEVLYLAPSAAHDRFGAYCPCSAGVIAVITRRSK